MAGAPRALLNVASHGAVTVVMLVVALLMADRQRATAQAPAAAGAGGVTVSISGWWILTLYRVAQIESRLRGWTSRPSASARLQLAAAQIQPHFLFNPRLAAALDTGDACRAAVAQLHGLPARHAADNVRHALPAATSEIDMACSYLEIMQTCLGERLRFSISVDPVVPSSCRPAPLLTLAENAIATASGPNSPAAPSSWCDAGRSCRGPAGPRQRCWPRPGRVRRRVFTTPAAAWLPRPL